jgi:hypothetical protein
MSGATSQSELVLEAQAVVRSKILNTQRHLMNLEAKKARIELEIKKTRRALKKHKQSLKQETVLRESFEQPGTGSMTLFEWWASRPLLIERLGAPKK